MYLSDDIEFKKSQLKGKDDYLQNIYYYNPSVSSIMKYSNILRSDLGLSKITDKDEFLDRRVIKHYGTLIPLTPLDRSLLKNNQKIHLLLMITTMIQQIQITIIIYNHLKKIVQTQMKVLTKVVKVVLKVITTIRQIVLIHSITIKIKWIKFTNWEEHKLCHVKHMKKLLTLMVCLMF